MDIILATRNPSKAEQIQAVFTGTDIKVSTLSDTRVEGQAVEDGDTLEENSLKKARYVWDRTHRWVIADDTGVFIDALGGIPGVHAATWAGNVSTEEAMHFILGKMKDIPAEKRTVTFRTLATVISPEGTVTTFNGEAPGKILEAPRGTIQPNMPYSPLFIPDGQTKTWSEMSIEEENIISHRGRAFRQVRDFLQKQTITSG